MIAFISHQYSTPYLNSAENWIKFAVLLSILGNSGLQIVTHSVSKQLIDINSPWLFSAQFFALWLVLPIVAVAAWVAVESIPWSRVPGAKLFRADSAKRKEIDFDNVPGEKEVA